jgi:hypothetical protein
MRGGGAQGRFTRCGFAAAAIGAMISIAMVRAVLGWKRFAYGARA